MLFLLPASCPSRKTAGSFRIFVKFPGTFIKSPHHQLQMLCTETLCPAKSFLVQGCSHLSGGILPRQGCHRRVRSFGAAVWGLGRTHSSRSHMPAGFPFHSARNSSRWESCIIWENSALNRDGQVRQRDRAGPAGASGAGRSPLRRTAGNPELSWF